MNLAELPQIRNANLKILKFIGEGQFGRVFCAINQTTGKLFALKELPCRQLATNVFLQELNFLVSLDHPHVVSCYGLAYSTTDRYLILDYYKDGNLRQLIDTDNQLTLIEKLNIIIDILSALEYIHQRGIVHRDLKPENILIQRETNKISACISDFGIAKYVDNYEKINSNLGDTGSPAYMAPERFYGKYNKASDIYGMGVFLFEMVVGERPFFGLGSKLISAHLNQQVNIPDQVPFILRSTIQKSLAKLPQKRFTCAAEMAKSLQLAIAVLQATSSA